MENITDDFDYLLVLDFEAQCEKDTKLNVQEIIEFPVILIDVKNLKVLDNFFHTYVKPVNNPKLFQFCKELTGITQDKVDNGIILEETLKKLDEFLDQNLILNSKFTFVTCGDWDLMTCLRHETKFKKIEYQKYLKKWINVKKVFQDFIGEKKRVNMVEMLKEFNIELEGRHHSGIDDSRNIAKIILHMLQQGKKITRNYEIDFSNKK